MSVSDIYEATRFQKLEENRRWCRCLIRRRMAAYYRDVVHAVHALNIHMFCFIAPIVQRERRDEHIDREK